MRTMIDPNQKPQNMSQLYWDYLKGKIDEEGLTSEQFMIIAIEKHAGYIKRGGKQNFQEFYADIEICGL